MIDDAYNLTSDDSHLVFRFQSVGPNGMINKLIRFELLAVNGFIYFNLAFGNEDRAMGDLDDIARSNNGDAKIILATVAKTVIKMFEQFPTIPVYARGSTTARTRLYQMELAKHYFEIEQRMELFGLTTSGWEKFVKNKNYEAFLARSKESINFGK